MQIHKALVPLLALGVLFGCGGGSHSGGSSIPGTVNIYLGSDSIPGFSSVVVSVAKLEYSTDGVNFGSLGTFNPNSYDLFQLQNGNGFGSAGEMITDVILAPTTIKAFRITWQTTSNPVHANEGASFVIVPSITNNPACTLTMPTTTVVPCDVEVTSGGTNNVEIMITGAGSIQNTGKTSGTGANITPIFSFANATGQAFDIGTTATLTGQLNSTVTATAAPLAGVEVYAETTVNGVIAIVRRSITDSQGNFTLDALPSAATPGYSTAPIYYVVSSAYSATNAVFYNPQASAPITANAATTYTNLGLNFPTLASSLGAITASITPASLATESTWVEVSQGLPTPANQTLVVQNLIVQSVNAGTNSGATADTATVTSLPIGVSPNFVPYTVVAQRVTTPNPIVVPILPVAATAQTVNAASPATPVTFVYKN